MTHVSRVIEVQWDGPFCWPGFETNNALSPVPETPGIYLLTFEYEGDYLIYAAGLTRRPISIRLKEHTRKYNNGEYNVLDMTAAQAGVRKEIWHGWDYARKHREEFEQRRLIIIEAVAKQLAGFRIFVTDFGNETRILERVEAAVMNNLYIHPPPICDIPDKGMYLAGRWDSENPIIVKNNCSAVLHGLPTLLEI